MGNDILNRKYEPQEFEENVYQNWEKKGYFHSVVDETKEPYTIVMPPPNITGKLHMGHALDNTIQDILIRYKKMAGFNALWVPGTDHAALSTEYMLCKELEKEGTSKEELGRAEFKKRIDKWIEGELISLFFIIIPTLHSSLKNATLEVTKNK